MSGSHRGVWKEPYHGPNGETILFAMNKAGELVGDRLLVPVGLDEWEIAQWLWHVLNNVDPSPTGSPPRFGAIPRSVLRDRWGLQVVRGGAA